MDAVKETPIPVPLEDVLERLFADGRMTLTVSYDKRTSEFVATTKDNFGAYFLESGQNVVLAVVKLLDRLGETLRSQIEYAEKAELKERLRLEELKRKYPEIH